MILTKEELKVLEDMRGFISFAIKKDQPYDWTLFQLYHDCAGILQKEVCFVPRTSGYAEHSNDYIPKE